jgi:hypothetical protein
MWRKWRDKRALSIRRTGPDKPSTRTVDAAIAPFADLMEKLYQVPYHRQGRIIGHS